MVLRPFPEVIGALAVAFITLVRIPYFGLPLVLILQMLGLEDIIRLMMVLEEIFGIGTAGFR